MSSGSAYQGLKPKDHRAFLIRRLIALGAQLTLLGVRLYSNWVTLMFRNATGPWSPWKKIGPVGCSGVSRLTLVPCATSTFSCTNCPLRTTLTNFAFDIFFPVPSNLGARKSMSNCCHSPAFLQAFTLG